MKHMIWRVLLLSFGLVLSAAAFGQGPKSYRDGHGGEVFFPVGDISFADEVVSFTSGEPKARAEKDRIPEETLGIPDYDRDEDDNFLTLGCGGVVVVRFTDNSLIDIDGPDLYVFEIGPAVEPTDLAISRDGESWFEIGRIAGGRADVDIAQFVDGCEPYSHVRLTDGRMDCGGQVPGSRYRRRRRHRLRNQGATRQLGTLRFWQGGAPSRSRGRAGQSRRSHPRTRWRAGGDRGAYGSRRLGWNESGSFRATRCGC